MKTKPKTISANEWFVEYYKPLYDFSESKGKTTVWFSPSGERKTADIFFDDLEGSCVKIIHALITRVDTKSVEWAKESYWGATSHSDWVMGYVEAVTYFYRTTVDSKWFVNRGVVPVKTPKKKKSVKKQPNKKKSVKKQPSKKGKKK